MMSLAQELFLGRPFAVQLNEQVVKQAAAQKLTDDWLFCRLSADKSCRRLQSTNALLRRLINRS